MSGHLSEHEKRLIFFPGPHRDRVGWAEGRQRNASGPEGRRRRCGPIRCVLLSASGLSPGLNGNGTLLDPRNWASAAWSCPVPPIVVLCKTCPVGDGHGPGPLRPLLVQAVHDVAPKGRGSVTRQAAAARAAAWSTGRAMTSFVLMTKPKAVRVHSSPASCSAGPSIVSTQSSTTIME